MAGNRALFTRSGAAGLAGLLLSGLGCASSGPGRIEPPRVDAAALVREADAEIDRGCYLCLISATEKYEAAIASGAVGLERKAAGALALVAARERELGLRPSTAIESARKYAGGPDGVIVDAYLSATALIPLRSEGVSKEAMSAAAAAARAITGASRNEADESRLKPLRASAAGTADPAARYLVAALECVGRTPRAPEAPETSPLLMYLAATCDYKLDPGRDLPRLKALRETEPRFHEARYFEGRLHLAERKLVSAEREFLAAANGLPRMTAAWAQLGSARLRLEEYDWASQDLARALDIEPDQREALLALAQALNYAGRFEEAMTPARRLIDLGAWYVSDANYWLAFSELQLRRLRDADDHVREARRTNPMNGDTARLSGLVAYHLGESDRARGEFEFAISRNPADCEALLHLGLIHGQQDRPASAVVSFVRARDCYSRAADGAMARRREIEESALTEVRKEVALLRLAQRVEAARRSQASASLGAAEGEAARGSFEAALTHATDASGHPDFVARVEDLRKRIAAQGKPR